MPSFNYRAPSDLQQTPLSITRVVVVGSCLAQAWPRVFTEEEAGLQADFYLFNNATVLPSELPSAAPYDFQIVQLPLRTVIPDYLYFTIDDAHETAFAELLESCRERLRTSLAAAMQWNTQHGLLSFVTNFMVPQQNTLGRLMRRNDPGNFVYFVEQLNQTLAAEIGHYSNGYLLDIDQIAADFGRRYIQDDVVWHFNHGSALSNADFSRDQDRLEPIQKATDVFHIKNRDFVGQVWAEARAMYRTIRQVDQVKLVVLDIDDTLCRGVAAERLDHDGEQIEGWPLGLVDALKILKRRGILLAIASKNDKERVAGIWEKLFRNKISLDDFASVKINWSPKVENFGEILEETNLLPTSVVFIDDNPVEREAIRSAYPGVRVLGGNPYCWRSILLWAPETQTSMLTSESLHRTTMVKAQISRERQRSVLSRDEFLSSLSLKVSVFQIGDVRQPEFNRALELINKTNQFNTTGKKWTQQELSKAMASGMRLCAFSASDIYTDYGIVGVVAFDADELVQFVMSCRVAGLEVEHASFAAVCRMLQVSKGNVTARHVETGLNLLCNEFFSTAGFVKKNGILCHQGGALYEPSHVVVTIDTLMLAMSSSDIEQTRDA